MKPKLAKITMPVLDGVVRRPRLFRMLDSMVRKHRMVWLGAPAGSGKTTIAASWLKELSMRCLWYRIDSRDADPSTFFYYMREGVLRLTPHRRDPLPLLTPEYALGLDAYTHNFFEHVGARLQRRSFLVFDNYQELPESSPLQRLLPVALSALPLGVCVLILSREPPPPPFVRFFAERRLSLIESSALNLSCSETRALSRMRGLTPLTSRAASALHAATGGWLAGTVLLLETNGQAPFDEFGTDLAAQQMIFDYFAAEVLNRAPQATQRFLLETAILPQVSAQTATALTGEKHSAEILIDLQRRNYFTFRLDGTEPRYEYHPLFRDFLLARVRQSYSVERLRNISDKAIKILIRMGNLEDATARLVEEGNYGRLSELIVEQAPELLRQGRLASLGAWISALPAEVLNRTPWLSYYLGLVRRVSSPEEGRVHFERAYRLFKAINDTKGMFLAWAGCVDTFVYVWDVFTPLDPWIAAMDKLHGQNVTFPSPDVECQVVFGMLASLMWRQPAHPKMGYWLGRAADMVRANINQELRMHLATYLLFHCIWWSGDHERADEILNQMRPLLSSPDLTPLTQLLWFVMEAAYDARMGYSTACFEAVERGLALAEKTGILILNHQLAMQGIYAGLAVGDIVSAKVYHKKAGQFLRPSERLNLGHYQQLGAWIFICAGEFPRAWDFFRDADKLVDASGAALSQSWSDLTLAHLLVECDAVKDAVPLLERALSWGRETANPIIEHHCLLSLAYARKREGRETEAVTWLREGLRIGKERHYVVHPWIGWRRDVISELAALALDRQIEPQYVVEQILARDLTPPKSAAAFSAWPGSTRIHTLGRFEIWCGEERVGFSRKYPRRQIECLQTLIALGVSEVSDETICDALWPDADGDLAHHALETMLSRLRKLLGSPHAITYRERKLSLDRGTCWTDMQAIQGLLARGLEMLKHGPQFNDEIQHQTENVLALYRGPFMADAREDLSGVLAMRDRLRDQLSRYLRAVELHLTSTGGHLDAHYLDRARQADPDLLLSPEENIDGQISLKPRGRPNASER